ncbi:MAG: NAAT family transporter [Rickettsiales bacterium]|nr:NAAT family transporter [Rickettsiales bacterium]
MLEWTQYLQMFTGLFAIMNPISAVPLYLTFTENVRGERAIIARHTAFAVGVILVVTLFVGTHILHLFSISIDAFRVAGGILLMFIAFNMLQARVGRTRHTPEEDEEAMDSSSVAVVPLALPLLAGPGAISTVILFSNQAESEESMAVLVGMCILIALIIWLVLHLAPQIGKRMSRTAMNITTRVMGLIMASMSIEFIVGGLRNLLPGLAGV